MFSGLDDGKWLSIDDVSGSDNGQPKLKKGKKLMYINSDGLVVSDTYSDGLEFVYTNKKVGEKWK